MILELNPQERDLLLELLRGEVDELGPEIHHTDRREYREGLQSRRHLLQDLLDRIVQQPQHQ